MHFVKATLDNQEKEFELAVLNFGEQSSRFNEFRRELLLANPDMSYYLYDHEHMVASINITPLRHDGILKFKTGERGWLLGEHIVPFKPDRPLEVIIIDFITTPLATDYRRTQYAMHLIFGLGRLLEEWGKQGIIIKSIYASGGTPQGRHLLETAGFKKIGEFGARHIYEVDVEEADLKLLSSYKAGIAEYKASKEA